MKKAIKNILASMLPQAMNIITNLILPTLIITQYGSDINGLISSSRVLLGYIALVGAGISVSITQALYKPVAQQDIRTVNGMLHAAANMFNRYGCIYIVITLVVSFIYPFLIKNVDSHFLVTLLLWVMSLSGISEFFIIGRSHALLCANQKVYVTTTIQAISLAISLIAAIILLKLQVNIVLVQLAISMVYVSRAFLLTWYIRSHYPQYVNFRKTPPILQAVHKRKNALIHQLSGLVVMGTQPLILTLLIGLEATSIYAVYNIVFSGLQSICGNLNGAITPFFGRENALHNECKMHKMYNLLEFLFFNLVTFMYSVCAVTILPFIFLYTRNADINYIYPTFAILFVYTSSLYVIKIPSNMLIIVAGHFKETQFRAILEASLTLVLGIIFTFWLKSILGVLIGTSIAIGWRCLDTIMYSNKYILKGHQMKSLFRVVVVYATITLFYFISRQQGIIYTSYLDWVIYACKISGYVGLVLLLETFCFERKSLYQLIYLIRYKKLG